MDPDEGRGGRRVNARGGEVSCRGCDDAADEETHDDGAGFHDGAAEALAEDDGREDGEAKTDIFGASPWQGVRRTLHWAHAERSAGWTVDTAGRAGTSCPVLEPTLNESDADEHDLSHRQLCDMSMKGMVELTVGPVTSGGKTFLRTEGLVKERPISSIEHRAAVPNKAPYPFGQASFEPSGAEGQYPVSYICANAPVATGMMEKEVPTTEINPVPT